MRRTPFLILAASAALACADTSSSLLEPQGPSLAGFVAPDYPPPPFAVVDGSASTEYGTFSFVAHLFINKPGNVAWLQFKSSATATFSANARIMSVNGTPSGVGTISLNGGTIQLNEIDSFVYQTYRTTGSTSFSGGKIWRGFTGKDIEIGIGDGPVVICCDVIVTDPNGKLR